MDVMTVMMRLMMARAAKLTTVPLSWFPFNALKYCGVGK
jgi:hypothetical protein